MFRAFGYTPLFMLLNPSTTPKSIYNKSSAITANAIRRLSHAAEPQLSFRLVYNVLVAQTVGGARKVIEDLTPNGHLS
jgi:hypothetical protein